MPIHRQIEYGWWRNPIHFVTGVSPRILVTPFWVNSGYKVVPKCIHLPLATHRPRSVASLSTCQTQCLFVSIMKTECYHSGAKRFGERRASVCGATEIGAAINRHPRPIAVTWAKRNLRSQSSHASPICHEIGKDAAHIRPSRRNHLAPISTGDPRAHLGG
jgi:hypothetical protein